MGVSGGASDDDLWMKMQLARLKDTDPDDEADSEEESRLLLKMHEDYKTFKSERHLIDFTGMIEEAITRRIVPEDITEIFVDEAQDMCALFYQYHLMLYEELGPSVPVTWMGDEDQSIYYFLGSDPRFFVEHPAIETIYGESSYRLTDVLAREAMEYISGNTERFPKQIHSLKPGEENDHMWNLDQVLDELDAVAVGEVLWLATTNAQLYEIREELQSRGYPLKTTDDEKAFRRLVETIKTKSRTLTYSTIKDLVSATVAGKKVVPYQRKYFKEPYTFAREMDAWEKDGGPPGGKLSVTDDRFTPLLQGILLTGEWDRLLTSDELEKATTILEAGEKPFTIELCTFHKAKGREAPYVVICKDVSGKILKWVMKDEEGARRLGFVAMTRALVRNIYYRKDIGKGQDYWRVSR